MYLVREQNDRWSNKNILKFSPSMFHELSMVSYFEDIGKQNSPRWDVTQRGVPAGAIPFAYKYFIEK